MIATRQPLRNPEGKDQEQCFSNCPANMRVLGSPSSKYIRIPGVGHGAGNLCVLLWLLLLFVLFLTDESDTVKFENHWLRVLMRVSNKYLLIPTVLDLLW